MFFTSLFYFILYLGTFLSSLILSPLMGDQFYTSVQDYVPSSYVRVKTVTGTVKVDINEYLKGVLPSEMPAGWPIEALKAQAIAARSYVLWQMQQRTLLPFDVDDSIQFQVYKPQNFLKLSKTLKEKIIRAVNETRGYYLIDFQGRPYSAFFHADCGGMTEQAEVVWGTNLSLEDKEDKNVLVKDQHCHLSLENRWNTFISRDQLAFRLLNYFKFKKNIKLIDVTADSFTNSGRVNELMIHMAYDLPGQKNNFQYRLSAQAFRKLFGFNRVKSANFNLRWSEDGGLFIMGRGRGHGVGLCQSGARFMALEGESFIKILNHYYPQVQIHAPMILTAEK